MKQRWYVVYVASRTEKKVLERLKNKGFDAYVPIQKKLQQWSDRKKWVDMVVLNSYVFVRIDLSQKEIVLNTPGVIRFLKHLNEEVFVKDKDMDVFMNFISKADKPVRFIEKILKEGDRIQVVSGDFKGYSGEIIRNRKGCKLYIHLEHFGYFVISDQDVELKDMNKKP